MRMGDNAKARTFQDKAMTFYKQANDYLGEGDVYRSIGDIYYFTTENSEAMEMYNKALPFFIKAREPTGQGHIYARMGEIYLRTSDNERALEMFTRALPLYKQVNDPIGLGDVYFDTGRLNNYKRDYQRALEMYEKAVPYYSMAGDPRGMGNVYQGMANVYLRVGDYQRTLACCAKALSHYVQANSPLGQANIYWNMGEAHFYLGDYQRALEAYGKALPLYRKVGEPIGQGVVYQDMAEIYFKSGDYQKALNMNEEALALCRQAGSLIDQIRVYRSLGDIYAKTGKNEQSLQMYDAALDISRKIADIDAEAYILVNKAAVLGRTGKISEAAGVYEEGMARFERVRRQSGFSEMKKTYMEKVYDHYEDATIFMITNLYVDKAFKYAEAMKARVFLDQLAEGLVNLNKGIDPELKTRSDEIENRLSLIQKQIEDESQRKQSDEAKYMTLKSEYVRTEEELEAVKREIHYKNPQYASVRYPVPVTVAELQGKVLSKEEVLLEYFIASQGVFCFVVTTDSFEVVKLAVSEADLINRVETLLENIRPGYARGEGYDRFSAGQLYDILVKPFEKAIEGRTLIIVPDDILARLPFEALVIAKEGKRSYLFEKYVVKYIQSSSVLALLRTHGNSAQTSERFIGFGDPVYDYENFKRRKQENAVSVSGRGIAGLGVRLGRLEASGDEIRAIKRLFQKKKIKEKTFLREEARKDYAKGVGMDQYGYIHFSMHGIVTPKLQAIAFSQIPGSSDDCLLTVSEIMNLRYNARLVVLSACQTGLGRPERGEGIIGLTRAVMYAGSSATVVSLWNVDDNGTKELMTQLYKNIIQKKASKAEALRQAKHDLLKTQYRHPLFWAAFVLYGE